MLKIYTPAKKFLEKRAAKVVLPAHEGNLTVLKDRVPSNIILDEGKVDILDDNAVVLKSYHIGHGLADIANNVCTVYASFAEKTD